MQDVFKGLDGLVALLVGETQDLLQGESDVGDVLLDVLALLELALQALLLAREALVTANGSVNRALSGKYSRLVSLAHHTLRGVTQSLKAIHRGRTRSLRTLRKQTCGLRMLNPIP